MMEDMNYAVYDKVNEKLMTPLFGTTKEDCIEFREKMNTSTRRNTMIVHFGWHEVKE